MKSKNDVFLCENMERLIKYGKKTGLIESSDVIYTRNMLMEILELSEPSEMPFQGKVEREDLEDILMKLCDGAFQKGLFKDNTTTQRDLFDTRLMSVLVKRPSEVIRDFSEIEAKSGIEEATNQYYLFSKDTNYIRRYRVNKDIKWVTETPYGDLDITINLSKPEKNPREIAEAAKLSSATYPKCLLCAENEGFSGNLKHPARQNHRVIPITLNGEAWGLQYSPYVYFNEHCIVFHKEHVPMKITEETFRRLLTFVERFPHYILGSNADIPIVGGSILSHDHFQGGRYEFPMARAASDYSFTMREFPEIEAETLKWPLAVIRLRSDNLSRLVQACGFCLTKWRNYSDEVFGIFAYTNGEIHNTITPIARKRGDKYEMDLVLRNNITSKEHPLGVFHPHAEYHHIKKENIGLIEVMGLAILPSRLKKELDELRVSMLTGRDLTSSPDTEKHAEWAKQILEKHPDFCESNAEAILRQEIGIVFSHVLEDAGVYKTTPEGREGFRRFTNCL